MFRQVAAHVFSISKATGVEAAVRNSAWRRNRLLVLCWHGIFLADEHESCGGSYVLQEVFRDRLHTLTEGGYNVLDLDSALQQLHAGELPPRSVAITFDDGFYDFKAKA